MKRLNILLLFFLPLSLWAQEQDFQLWSKVELAYKPHKKVAIGLSEGFRLRENASLPTKSFTNISFNYRHNKQLRFGGGYRFIQAFDLDQSISLRHRYYADVVLRLKKKRWQWAYRARLQQQVGVNHQETYHRGRLNLSYNVKKTPLEPFVAAEGFYDFDNTLDKMRYTLGLSYPISKNMESTVYYRLQQELNVSNPASLSILGLSLAYRL